MLSDWLECLTFKHTTDNFGRKMRGSRMELLPSYNLLVNEFFLKKSAIWGRMSQLSVQLLVLAKLQRAGKFLMLLNWNFTSLLWDTKSLYLLLWQARRCWAECHSPRKWELKMPGEYMNTDAVFLLRLGPQWNGDHLGIRVYNESPKLSCNFFYLI